MRVEHNNYIGIRDVNKKLEVTNTGILAALEDVACIHSEIAGFGITDIPRTNLTWILINWKVEVLNRPKYDETIKVETWSSGVEKLYTTRDFYIYNERNEKVAKATSRWLLLEADSGKIVRDFTGIIENYHAEDERVFGDEKFSKVVEPATYKKKIDYIITKNMIDINDHLHNIYYMDIAYSIIPEEKEEFNNFEVVYKKEIKLGETVKVLYEEIDDISYVTIKSNDETELNAIIKLW